MDERVIELCERFRRMSADGHRIGALTLEQEKRAARKLRTKLRDAGNDRGGATPSGELVQEVHRGQRIDAIEDRSIDGERLRRKLGAMKRDAAGNPAAFSARRGLGDRVFVHVKPHARAGRPPQCELDQEIARAAPDVHDVRAADLIDQLQNPRDGPAAE